MQNLRFNIKFLQLNYALCFASSVLRIFQSANYMKDDSHMIAPTFLQRGRGGYCSKKVNKQNVMYRRIVSNFFNILTVLKNVIILQAKHTGFQ